MFDIGWTELLVIGIVALIVVGPKDLPGMFRTLGRFTGKAKAMARDFQRAMDDAADEAGVKDVKKTLQAAADPKSMGLDAIKDATTSWSSTAASGSAKGPETAKLTEERAEAARKIREGTSKKAKERKATEAKAAEAADAGAKVKKKPPAKTPTAKKPAAKKPAAKKPAAKKPAAKKPAVKKPAAKKPAAKKPAAAKAAVSGNAAKAPTKKPTRRKPAAKPKTKDNAE